MSDRQYVVVNGMGNKWGREQIELTLSSRRGRSYALALDDGCTLKWPFLGHTDKAIRAQVVGDEAETASGHALVSGQLDGDHAPTQRRPVVWHSVAGEWGTVLDV